MNIRRADPTDAASLAVLAEFTFRAAFSEQNTPENMNRHCAGNFGRDLQLQEITDPMLVTWVAEDSGRLVGYSQLRLSHAVAGVTGKRPAEIKRIYVSSEWHGRSAARELMQRVLAAATDSDCDYVWLGVWEHNPRAIAFYRKFGFEVVGEHAFMLGQELQRDLIMTARVG
jgi:ribosomal protein S18 acetylase RimI-like enzyme